MSTDRKKGDQRLKIQQWSGSAKRLLDDGQYFNAYFSAYVALVAASAVSQMRRGGNDIDRDDDRAERLAIEDSMKTSALKIDDYLGLLQDWLTFFVPGVLGPEGCCYAEEVSAGVQA